MHQRADTIVEGLSVRLYVQKKGAFNRVGQQAPIEFRTTKDVAVQHCIDILRIRLTTTFDRRGQSKAAKTVQKNQSELRLCHTPDGKRSVEPWFYCPVFDGSSE